MNKCMFRMFEFSNFCVVLLHQYKVDTKNKTKTSVQNKEVENEIYFCYSGIVVIDVIRYFCFLKRDSSHIPLTANFVYVNSNLIDDKSTQTDSSFIQLSE